MKAIVPSDVAMRSASMVVWPGLLAKRFASFKFPSSRENTPMNGKYPPGPKLEILPDITSSLLTRAK